MNARPFHEPEENEAREALMRGELPLPNASPASKAEQAIDRVIGLLADVRSEVGRTAVAPAAAGPKPAPSPAPKYTTDQLNLLLNILHATRALEEHARRAKSDSPIAKRDALSRDFLRALSDDIKAGRLIAAEPLACLNIGVTA
jgi:hypothetical protein